MTEQYHFSWKQSADWWLQQRQAKQKIGKTLEGWSICETSRKSWFEKSSSIWPSYYDGDAYDGGGAYDIDDSTWYDVDWFHLGGGT